MLNWMFFLQWHRQSTMSTPTMFESQTVHEHFLRIVEGHQLLPHIARLRSRARPLHGHHIGLLCGSPRTSVACKSKCRSKCPGIGNWTGGINTERRDLISGLHFSLKGRVNPRDAFICITFAMSRTSYDRYDGAYLGGVAGL